MSAHVGDNLNLKSSCVLIRVRIEMTTYFNLCVYVLNEAEKPCMSLFVISSSWK